MVERLVRDKHFSLWGTFVSYKENESLVNTPPGSDIQLSVLNGTTTLRIMTLSIMTLSIMTLSIMTLIIMALSIMTLSIMALSIMALSIMVVFLC
jgi:hypothetical protein